MLRDEDMHFLVDSTRFNRFLLFGSLLVPNLISTLTMPCFQRRWQYDESHLTNRMQLSAKLMRAVDFIRNCQLQS